MEDGESVDESSEKPSNSKDDIEGLVEAIADEKIGSEIPKRNLSRLWLHASIMCGREFLYAVEIVLVTPIILQLGMPEKFYSFMWCFSPIIGVLVGPILGSWSDQSTSRFGRRRPYIVVFVIGAVIGLTLLIFSNDIVTALGNPSEESQRLWGVVVGVLGAQVMDFCLDQSETPLRAYTLDVCSSEDQQRAFALQTVFIGIGGALGFIVDGIDWQSTSLAKFLGSQIKVVYIFAVLVYLITTACNLASIEETPWSKRVTSSWKSKICKCGSSKLPPPIKQSASNQTSGCSDCSYTPVSGASESHVMNRSPPPTPCVLLTVCEDEEDTKRAAQDQSRHRAGRPVSLLPRISMSKGLYMSTSCPGGLHGYGVLDDKSSSSLGKLDSTIEEEDSNLQSASGDDECDDVSLSMPTLQIKRSLPRRRSLLSFVRSKEFSTWSTRSREYNSKSSEIIEDNLENSDSSKQLIEDSGLRTTPTRGADVCNNVVITTKYNSHYDDIRTDDKQPASASGCSIKKHHHARERQEPDKKETKKRKEMKEDLHVSLKQLWLSIATMPSQLKWLCFCQLLGFVGMETVLLWYTDLMGRVVYLGDPQAPANSTQFVLYNSGVKMGCWGLTIYSMAMVIFSVAMERMNLLSRFRTRTLYSSAFLLMTIAMVFMFIFVNKYVILVLSWCVGVSLAIILTVPYYLVGKYHQDTKYVSKSPGKSKRGFGLDCAILACQMYAGNFMSAAISSPIIHVCGTCRAMLLLTGVCHFLAFFGAYFFVTYPDNSKLCCHEDHLVSVDQVQQKVKNPESEIG